jgi:hypothetical protein
MGFLTNINPHALIEPANSRVWELSRRLALFSAHSANFNRK